MSPERSRLHLAAPPQGDALVDFPHRVYGPGAVFFRSHPHGRDPRWYGSSGDARFDLQAPHGTCYTAESESVALLETWAGMQLVPEYLVAQRGISALQLRAPLRVADMTANTAIRFGVTAEAFTTIEYTLTQQWAAALSLAGFAGIRYWARHDLAHTAACVALFAAGGESADDTILEVLGTDALSGRRDLLTDLEAETGITVLPVPPI